MFELVEVTDELGRTRIIVKRTPLNDDDPLDNGDPHYIPVDEAA